MVSDHLACMTVHVYSDVGFLTPNAYTLSGVMAVNGSSATGAGLQNVLYNLALVHVTVQILLLEMKPSLPVSLLMVWYQP